MNVRLSIDLCIGETCRGDDDCILSVFLLITVFVLIGRTI